MKPLILVIALAYAAQSFAAKLSDYTPYDFEVLFTNPVCSEYKYDRPVYAEDGSLLKAKPNQS